MHRWSGCLPIKLWYQKYKKFTFGNCKWFKIHMRNLIMNCLFWIEIYQYTRNIYLFWLQFIRQLTHFRPMFHLQTNQVFTSKMFEKHLWKSDIKDAGHRPACLLKMLLFHRCFSKILLVNRLPGFYMSRILVENWLINWIPDSRGIILNQYHWLVAMLQYVPRNVKKVILCNNL